MGLSLTMIILFLYLYYVETYYISVYQITIEGISESNRLNDQLQPKIRTSNYRTVYKEAFVRANLIAIEWECTL